MAASKCNIVQNHIENIITYLQPLLPLANSHMVDYFSKTSFENCVPQELKTEILKVGYEQVISILLDNKVNFDTPKLSEYINKSRNCCLYNIKNICISKDDLNKKILEWGCNNLSSLKLEVFMTPKKSHEVETLSKVAAALSYIKKTTHVVDIGDGKGYLSSMLALHHTIPVLGIDASLINTDGAVKRVRMLSKVWNGVTKKSKTSVFDQKEKNNCINEKLYKQITEYVTENTDLKQLVSNVFLENSLRLGLVGLHTCGNLGSTSIRIFNNDTNIKTICNVSCCYHLLNEEFELDSTDITADKNIGFPLSSFLRNLNFVLGRTARMLSSQSIDRILSKKELPGKAVFYRSILEVLLERYDVCPTKRQVGKIKKNFTDFPEYVHMALKNIGAD
ncbi:hypothetical protein ILUMI_06184, partial [Ignelater luminosus]